MDADAPGNRPLSPSTVQECHDLIASLWARLEESKDTLAAIERGDIDAVVVTKGVSDHRIYTLENADRPYRVLIEQIQEVAVILGTCGTIVYCNRRMADLLGSPQERVVGQKLHLFVEPAELAAFNRLLKRASNGHGCDEIMLSPRGGARVPVVVSLSPLQTESSDTLLCGGAGRPDATEVAPARAFRSQCAACHGRPTA